MTGKLKNPARAPEAAMNGGNSQCPFELPRRDLVPAYLQT
jgi:hypothetical protein